MSDTKENWAAFSFESNQAWGECETKEQWEEIKKNHLEYWESRGGLDLNKALMNCYITQEDIDSGKRIHDFGFGCEHTGEYSLAQFAIDNNMKL